MKTTHDILISIDEVTDKGSISFKQRTDEVTEKITQPPPTLRRGARPAPNSTDRSTMPVEPTHGSTPSTPTGIFKKLSLTLSMIKFPHSIFALPFALVSLFVATQGRPQILDAVMIILAMVTARNAAMTFNRLADFKFDKDNPRTKDRELVSAKLSRPFAIGFCVFNCVAFVAVSAYFNTLALALSPVALAIILGYSLTKRFTNYTQFFLGLSLGIAPIATWIAITGSVSAFSLLLGLGVLLWVAGFDIIYSTLDYNYDSMHGLKNLVVKWGIKNALFLARLLHAACAITFVLAGLVAGLGIFYLAGCMSVALLLVYEHSLVRHNDLSRVNAAFFTMNGYVAVVFLAFTVLDLVIYASSLTKAS